MANILSHPLNNCTAANAKSCRVQRLELYTHHSESKVLYSTHLQLSVSIELNDLARFLLRNVSFKTTYSMHGPQLLAACPRGGRFSCFSLMEKALGMKFPLTADSFKPGKRSALHCRVNRWGAGLGREYRWDSDSDVQKRKDTSSKLSNFFWQKI